MIMQKKKFQANWTIIVFVTNSPKAITPPIQN